MVAAVGGADDDEHGDGDVVAAGRRSHGKRGSSRERFGAGAPTGGSTSGEERPPPLIEQLVGAVPLLAGEVVIAPLLSGRGSTSTGWNCRQSST